MAKLFANSRDPDQTPSSAASDLVCTVCQVPFYGYLDYNGLNHYRLNCIFANIVDPEETAQCYFIGKFSVYCLTFTTLLAFSADDKLMIFFLFFPENRI